MTSTDKKPDPRFVLGIIFMASGIPMMAANVGVGVVMVVVGGVLMGASVAAAKKAARSDDTPAG